MKTISPRHYTLSVCVAAMLAGCGGSTQPSYQPPVASQNTRAQSLSSLAVVPYAACQGQQSFHYSGQSQNFVVPACATSVYVDAKGASGERGGSGGEVNATIPVTPGQTLIMTVGGAGGVERGGFNGGGAGTTNKNGKSIGGGGGGASDVRQGGNALANRVVVAGGGGGTAIGHNFAHHCHHCQALPASGTVGGGAGGGPSGGSGGTPTCSINQPVGGSGGTQSSGGSGGVGSNGGSLGAGGAGAGICLTFFQNPDYGTTYYASGGGGGYYGGGGGGNGGSGGGGSGYAEPSATNVSSQSGVNRGNGSILICWGYSNGCGSR